MTDPVQIPAAEIRQRLGEESLREWVQHQRWYASKSRAVAGIDIVESLTLRDDPLLMLALVQTRFATGTHELYQLPLGLRPLSELDAPDSIARGEEWTVYDALADPAQARELLRRMDSGEETETADGRFSFHQDRPACASRPTTPTSGRSASSSPTPRSCSTSEIVLKVFRKLEPGVNPELEMLRFLTAHEFPNIAPLHGWYEYEGLALVDDARRRADVPPRRRRRLGAGAGGDRLSAGRVPRAPRQPRTRHRASCTTCSPPTRATRRSRRRSPARRRCRC